MLKQNVENVCSNEPRATSEEDALGRSAQSDGVLDGLHVSAGGAKVVSIE